MSRKSTRIQASQTPSHKYPTRRQSVISNASSTPRANNSPITCRGKKLTDKDILVDLANTSGEEDQESNDKCTGKSDLYQTTLIKDNESIIVRFTRLEPGYNDTVTCITGLKHEQSLKTTNVESPHQEEQCKGTVRKSKKTTQPNNVVKTPKTRSEVSKRFDLVLDDSPEDKNDTQIKKKSSIQANSKSTAVKEPNNPGRRSLRPNTYHDLNVDHMFAKQLNSPVKSKQSIKSNDVRTPRKRAASTNYRNVKNYCEMSSENEVDENLMKNANKSPKRPKSTDNLNETPSKTRSATLPRAPRRPSKATVVPRQNLEKLRLDTPLQEKSRSETSASSYRSRSVSRKEKNLKCDSDSLYSPYNSESGDDNDKTYNSEEEDNESSSTDTEFSDDDDDEFDLKYKNNRKKVKILKTPSKNPKKISVETPTKSLAKMCLTPSMHQRTANIVKPSTPLQEARLKLHVSILPKSLPCREEQFNDIYTFLHARLSDRSGGCIYISGVPGTGKTATVNEVIRCLKKSMDAGKLTKFEFIDINGMKLSEPRQAYVQIWKQLTGQKTTWEEAHKLLQQKFSKSKTNSGMTLLLVDELDLLRTKRQDVVYNLLDWPTKTGAKLVVVTIANTMDLPERVLMGKVTSRLGLSRLTFPPYNYKQLEEIVLSRLRGYNAFGGDAIQLVARKVAAVSGDARRALDICRRATEIAENNDREVVSMIDVKRAVDEMIASPKIQAIKHCSEMERLFLQAVCSEIHRTGVEEVVFQSVYIQLGPLCTLNGEVIPNVTEALGMCARLGAWRLILCEHSRIDIHQRILLNVSADDVQFAIKAVEV